MPDFSLVILASQGSCKQCVVHGSFSQSGIHQTLFVNVPWELPGRVHDQKSFGKRVWKNQNETTYHGIFFSGLLVDHMNRGSPGWGGGRGWGWSAQSGTRSAFPGTFSSVPQSMSL